MNRGSIRKPRGGPLKDVRLLLRRPWVPAVLVLAAGASLAPAVNVSFGTEAAFLLEPQKALPVDPISGETLSVAEAWHIRVVERESQRLAEEYLQQGYRVSSELAQKIGRAALEHEIDLEVAFGLVRAESSFRNTATSPVGAVGLTQLMPRTATWIQPGIRTSDLRDEKTNLRVGFKYLRYLIDKYDGDTNLALLAYNRGPGTVDRALRQGRNPDNGYAAFVMGKKDHGHRLFTNSAPRRAAARPAANPARRGR